MQLSMFESLADISIKRRWHEQSMPAPIVVAIIHRSAGEAFGRPEPTFLLIRRAANPYRGQWALVGGKWDFGESLPAAVVREVKEETGLEVDFVALRGIVSERLATTDEEGSGAAHFLLLVCQVDARDGKASEQQEGAVAWFTQPQIEDLYLKQAVIPSDYVMLQRFIDAAEIPHYEVDMVREMSAKDSGPDLLRLARFAQVG